MKNRKLVLIEIPSTVAPAGRVFKVDRMTNTTEWKIGENLTEKQVDDLLVRVGNRAITVEIKGQ